MKAPTRMKYKLLCLASIIALLMLSDIAEAQYGAAHRATRRRTAVVVSSATHAADEQAAEQQAADQQAADQQAADQQAAEQQAAQEQAAQQEAAQGEHTPYGTVVAKLPEGCEPVVVDEVQYYKCGNDYYRAAYQENNLVYVTIEPPK